MGKMNIHQKNYLKAKALVETLEAEARKIEQDYIREHGITNPGGKIPDAIFMIDDEKTFDIANEATASKIDATGINEARDVLRKAEDDLIRFGLSIMPAKERQALEDRCFGENGHYVHIDVRKGVLDLAVKLDVSTIPVGV